jgi:hypothetical protein
MSRYRFELATLADDADLRHILDETPMAGSVAVTFRREPSYFAGAGVEGPFRQVVAARDTESGRLVGFGARSVRTRFVNGRPEAVGYLGTLRLLEVYRNRGLLARGFHFFKELHRDGRARLYLTTIAEDNWAALRVLTSGRAGLPAYHYAGDYCTAVLPLRCRRQEKAPAGVEVRPATPADLPCVLGFLSEVGPERQFFPCYEAGDFFADTGTFHSLRPGDLLLAFRGAVLVGMLAGWDQSGFRQTIVSGYGGPLRWLRPLYNCWARWRGLPRLPPAGQMLRYLTGALPVVKDADAGVFAALLGELRRRAAAGPPEYLMLGLHADDPLLPALKARAPRWYVTRLHYVCWEDGEAMRKGLDGRAPYLELGTL